MATNRIVSAAVGFLAAGLIAAGVEASPASMSIPSAPSSSSSAGWWEFWKSSPAPAPTTWPNSSAPATSSQASPFWHPVDYVSTKWHGSSPAQRQAPAARPTPAFHDSIALNNPVGPPTPELFVAMAQISERQGNVPQARHQLQHALSMWPNDIELLRAAGRMEDRVGNLPVAENLYQRAATANPQHAGALNDLGVCLAREGKLEQSVQSLEQSVYLQPGEARYRNNVATVLVEMRQDQRALAHLSAVHAPAEANYNLGQLLVERNRPQEAAKYFQAALGIDPAMQPAQKALAQLNAIAPNQPATVTAQNTAVPSINEITPLSPQSTPQQAVPQPSFPETARAPLAGQSTSAPPPVLYSDPGYASSAGAPTIRTAAAPRYLPPTAPLGPGNMVR